MVKQTVLACALLMVVGQAADAGGKKKGMSDAAITKLAMKAGPSDVTKNATIAFMGDDMKTRQIKAGTNGWVCMVMTLQGVTDSMCMDKEWQAWADAYMNKTDPKVDGVGVCYMLNGDHGASNTDPYAEKATADNQWVVSGPHVMILSPDAKTLDALPTDFSQGGPYVMWKGTKYQHIMVPMGPLPKQPKLPAKDN